MANLYATATENIVLIQDNQILHHIITEINAAKKSIYLCSFKLQYSTGLQCQKITQIYHALGKAVSRGVDVKILTNVFSTNKLSYSGNNIAGRILRRAGVGVRGPKSGRIIHAKYLICDGEVVILGSHNITPKAFFRNHEISLLIRCPSICTSLTNTFSSLYDHSSDCKTSSEVPCDQLG